MIDQLITALSKEVEMSAKEIADTIWLALQMQEFQAELVLLLPTEDEKEINKEGGQPNQEILPEPKPEISKLKETPNQSLEEQKAGIYPRNEQANSKSSSSDLSFKVPDAPSLREPLTLARALKPLMRRVPSGRELVLDEAATIQRIADEGLWIPVLRPIVEPWLDLELVVDEAISMQIWRHTIRELERLLKNYGIFRDVRVWGLITDGNEQVQIRRGIGTAAKNQTLRSPKELIDPNGRRLVLVVSDCVSSLWRNGGVTPVLELWAKQGSMAIVQMLPKWLWKRTALGRASEVRLQGLTPGVCNQKLIAKEVSFWDELDEETGVKVPVFTLEQDKVATWAQMLSGKGNIWTLGYVFKLNATPVDKESSLFNLTHSDLSAEQRVQAFRVTASPMARKLAGLLASAPVISLPIVRLIRETLLDKSQQVHVAEVFLGGLLKPLSEINTDINPDYVQYEFLEGVRELLVDSVPSQYVLNIVDKVSNYIAKKAGLSLEDFAAVLKNPPQVRDSEIVEEIQYFATVTANILRCLGGKYAKVAENLEKCNVTTSDRSADDAILMQLPSDKTSAKEARTLAISALQYLAEEPDLKDETVYQIIDTAINNLNDLDATGSKPKTPMDEAFCAVMQSRFGQLCRNRLLQNYVQASNSHRNRIGLLLSLTTEETNITSENAVQILNPLVEKLTASISVEERVDAAIHLIEAFFRLQTNKADAKINCLSDSFLRETVSALFTAAEEEMNNYAVSTAATWALAWLTNAMTGSYSTTYTLTEAELKRLQQIAMNKKRDAFARSRAALVLSICAPEKTVFAQADWLDEWALVADGAKSHKQLPVVETIDRPLDIDVLQDLISSPLPTQAKRNVAIALGRLGCFVPEMIEPLLQIFQDDTLYKEARDEALVYLALTGGHQVTSALMLGVNRPRDDADQYNFAMRCFLALISMSDIDTLKNQISLGMGEQTEISAYAYTLAGIASSEGRKVLESIKNHEKEQVQNAVANALSKSIQWDSPKAQPDKKSTSSKNDSTYYVDQVISSRGHLIHKLKAKDSTGRWAYYFVLIRDDVEPAFMEALKSTESIDLEDYGRVIASNYGEEPNENIKNLLKEKYGFDV
ncbi:MAG: hypothetical protein KME21_05400 [Desmonostoc vinosum HA7617-LM4]|jgi:hypothetical protein|nr:hypothetical protein [Desmonostoc vinosum HA7617-LM4]